MVVVCLLLCFSWLVGFSAVGLCLDYCLLVDGWTVWFCLLPYGFGVGVFFVCLVV